MQWLAFLVLLLLLPVSIAETHSVDYQVENKGISARIFFGADEPASYSPYEIFGPDDTVPHQKGRTDKNGFVSFVPDRPGKWLIKVAAESEHGGHAANIEILVDDVLNLDSFKKPLIATYSKLAVIFGVLFGMAGIYAYWTSRRRNGSS